MSKIKAIIVDPFTQKITEAEIENSLDWLKGAIDDNRIELVHLTEFEDLYVGKEGLFKANQQYFEVHSNGRVIPLAGKGVIVGNNPLSGDNRSTKLTKQRVSEFIRFVEPVTWAQKSKDNAYT